MVADTIYELCTPILQDASLEDEDKTDQLEGLLKKETELTGSALENAVLDVLWRFRESAVSSPSPPRARHTVLRRPSPAPWQISRGSTPLASSPMSGSIPVPPPGFGIAPPGFTRAKSSTASPFTSPRPSPRLAFSSPRIPHSPSLNAYEFPSETSPAADISGDVVNDHVDWLVNDDTASITSSTGGTPRFDNGLSSVAAPFQPYQMDMSPHDILRSVLGEARTNDEIERTLEANGYDFNAAIIELMGDQHAARQQAQGVMTEGEATILVGKSMDTDPSIAVPTTQQQRSGIVCKYFLSSGTCLRADCRFSHDLSNHICKYWMMGNCLAGESCVFSHDPSNLISRLAVEENDMFSGSPPLAAGQPSFQIQDYNSFPSLQQFAGNQWSALYPGQIDALNYPGVYNNGVFVSTPPGFLGHTAAFGEIPTKRTRSRPSSRHSRAATPLPAVDDPDAFPSLSASSGKGGKKHHGKRGGHGHGQKENKDGFPTTIADIVRMSPSPGPDQMGKMSRAARASAGSRENSAAALAIPAPQHIPWLETGERSNKAYLKARQEAIKHGGLRNKFLQSAAQAWNRNDSRAAKALSLRGQSENELMRQAHREAARQLYELRNKDASANDGELYVDLHGLHPSEAIDYLERALLEHQDDPSASSSSSQPKTHIYAITGTGHHSKNNKDKLGKAVRGFLNEWRYAYREFSVPGDKNHAGGILAIDPTSFDREKGRGKANAGAEGGAEGVEGEGESSEERKVLDLLGQKEGKVRIVSREEVMR